MTRRLLPCVIQEELSEEKAGAACGTVKSEMLKDDNYTIIIIIVSCYDQKPFYMIYSIAEEVAWSTSSKRVYSATLAKMVNY
eukprot:348771-Ditylum_brightwellii.AAC.1